MLGTPKIVLFSIAVVAFVAAHFFVDYQKERNDLYDLASNQLGWIASSGNFDKDLSSIVVIASGVASWIHKNGNFNKVNEDLKVLKYLIMAARFRLQGDPEVDQFFGHEHWEWVANFTKAKYARSSYSTKQSAADIYKESQCSDDYLLCFPQLFQKNIWKNVFDNSCIISYKCAKTMTYIATNSEDYNNRYLLAAKNLIGCVNFDKNFDALITYQMNKIYKDVTTLLYLHENKNLPAKYRTLILDKVILGAMNGYRNFLNDDVIKFVKSLANEDGTCGFHDDEYSTKQRLTLQSYTILMFRIKLYEVTRT